MIDRRTVSHGLININEHKVVKNQPRRALRVRHKTRSTQEMMDSGFQRRLQG